MWSTAREIEAGDTVIVWLTRDELQPLVVTPGKELNGKFGNYRHADLVGVPYGSKVGSRNGRGFIHLLRPSPELWTLALPHRTQILYMADIAFVVSFLNIRPGSRVVEAGTGSGSFSHSVARTVGPEGHLYSYEFHEVREKKAREEFRAHGMSDIVTIQHRNVCKDGFTIVDEVDAVFLDLPAPWEAIHHAKKALRKDKATRICCFSPCMEQVLRTVTTLNEAGFTDISMYETLLRPHEVHTIPVLQSVKEIGDKLKQAESKREVKRLKQVAASSALREKKRKRASDDEESSTLIPDRDDAPTVPDSWPVALKRTRADGEEPLDEAKRTIKKEALEGELDPSIPATSESKIDLADVESMITTADDVLVFHSAGEQHPETSPVQIVIKEQPTPTPVSQRIVSKVMQEVRGHTSYLTFAVLLPPVGSILDGPRQSNAEATPNGDL